MRHRLRHAPAGKGVRRERAFYGRVLFYNKGRYIFMAKFIFVTGGVVSGLGKALPLHLWAGF